MKQIYRRFLAEALDAQVPRLLPGYEPWPLKLSEEARKNALLFPGSRLFGRRWAEGSTFVHVIPHRRQEDLLAEVGWSISGRFPAHLSSHGPVTEPRNEFDEDDWLVSFQTLHHRARGVAHLGWPVWECSVPFDHPEFRQTFVEEDLAPVTEDQARVRTKRAVERCLSELVTIAITYIEQWLDHRRAGSRLSAQIQKAQRRDEQEPQ